MIQTGLVFPSTYQRIESSELLKAFDRGPACLQTAVAGLTDDGLRARPRPGKWSILQIVIHLADAEVMGAARIRQVFAQPGANLAVYDQELWCETFEYQRFDPKAVRDALDLFKSLRAATGRIFGNATDPDWKKSGFHPEFGTLTLRQLLELYADHSERHIEQILENRRILKKPVEIPILLKERLY